MAMMSFMTGFPLGSPVANDHGRRNLDDSAAWRPATPTGLITGFRKSWE
jgi:hypothetical protein